VGGLIVIVAAVLIGRALMQPKSNVIGPGGSTIVSIAVIPFVNLSEDPRQDYLSDGISEELLNQLAQSEGLRVAARRSSFAYKDKDLDVREIARNLNVDAILEGSLRRVGTDLRVTAQLIDAETGFNLWSDSFDSELTEILVVQDRISAEILDALKSHLGEASQSTPETRKTGIEVFNAYLLGQHYLKQRNKNALTKSLAYFDQAISFDPDYAPAYVGKANTYMLLSEDLYGNIPEDDALYGATILIDKSLAIDPNFALATVAKGQILYRTSQVQAALTEFEKAIDLDPSLAEGHFWRGRALLRQFRIEEATQAFDVSHGLDPLTMAPFINLIQTLTLTGQFDRAERLIKRFQELAPDEPSTFATTIVASSKGQLAEAYEGVKEAVSVNDYGLYRQELSVVLFELREIERALDLAPSANPSYLYSYLDPDQATKMYVDLPNDVLAANGIWIHMAVAEFMNQDFQTSAQYFERAIGGNEAIDGPLFGLLPERMRAPYLAYAWQKSGRIDRANQLIETIESTLVQFKNSGATARHLVLEARLNVLKGREDDALLALIEAHRSQKLSWFVLREPFFDTLRDRDAFVSLVKEVDDHINRERAKLGWDPVKS
jgi:TolB-like protein